MPRSRSGQTSTTGRPRDYRAVADFRSALRRFSHATEQLTRANGLTPRRYELLVMIEGAADDSRTATISQLATRLHLAQHTVTELVARAEAAGLLQRTTDPVDRRISHITLTNEGKRRLEAAAAALEPERAHLTEMLAVAYRQARELGASN